MHNKNYDIVCIHPKAYKELFDDTNIEQIKEHSKYQAIIKNIHTDYREFLERGRHSAHTKKLQCSINLFRFAFYDDGIAKRVLFQPIEVSDRVALLISACFKRSTTQYDRDVRKLVPSSMRKNNLREKDVEDCMKVFIDDWHHNEEQEMFMTSYSECFEEDAAGSNEITEVYAANYAPPGSGKSHMIQESLVRFLRKSTFEGENNTSLQVPRNTIVLVPGPYLLDAYKRRLNNRFLTVNTDESSFLEVFKESSQLESALLMIWNNQWSYQTASTLLRELLFEDSEKAGAEPRILLCTFEQFFKTLAGEEIYTSNPNYIKDMKSALVNRFEDADNTVYTMASGYPEGQVLRVLKKDFPELGSSKAKSSNGRLQKKGVNSDKKSDSKDAMWRVVLKRKSLVEKIRKGYVDQEHGYIRSAVAEKACKELDRWSKKSAEGTFQSVQLIVDEHQDLIPNELNTVFHLLKQHPLNKYRRDFRAFFYGDNQQRVSNILFSPEILNTIAHSHKLKAIKIIHKFYTYDGNYRIHREMALFASLFSPRAKNDRMHASFDFFKVPERSQSSQIEGNAIQITFVPDVDQFSVQFLSQTNERVVVFSPHIPLQIENDNVFVLSDWMSLKGLEFSKLIYVGPIQHVDGRRNLILDPLEKAQLYMAFTRAREQILIIQSKRSEKALHKWLDENIQELSKSLLNKGSEYEELDNVLKNAYTIVPETDLQITDWTDVIEFAEAFQQFQQLWAEWYTGNSDDFNIVHQVFINILFADKSLGFEKWKEERLDVVRDYISVNYSDWTHRLACKNKSDKSFAFLCLLSSENSMWYQYLLLQYPGLCELYKTEDDRLIEYEQLVVCRQDLGCDLLPEVSDAELIEHYCSEWIEARFRGEAYIHQAILSTVISDSMLNTLYAQIEDLQSEIQVITEAGEMNAK